jgi:WD40 repeat protein
MVNCVAFSSDGRTMASSSEDGTVRIWDWPTGKELRVLAGHDTFAESVAFSPDGHTLASGSGTAIRLWDVVTGKPLRTFDAKTSAVDSVAFSPDGRTVAGGNGDGSIRLWPMTGDAGPRILGLDGQVVSAVAFSPDGRTLATGSWDRKVQLWDVETGKPGRAFTGPAKVLAVAFSPDGRTIAAGGGDTIVRRWFVETGMPQTPFVGHSTDVYAVAFSPDGKTLASGSADNTVRVWDLANAREVNKFAGGGIVSTVAFSPNGRILAAGNWNSTVRMWNAQTGNDFRTLASHSGGLYSAAFTRDGRTFATGGDDHTVRIWDTQTGRQVRTIAAHAWTVFSIALSPDGKSLVSGGLENSVRLWDVEKGTQLHELVGHKQFVESVAFAPDGQTVASGSLDKTIRLWDVHTGAELRKMTLPSVVMCVTFSPDGATLASVSSDQLIRLWEVKSGKGLAELTVDAPHILSIAFSPDGRFLACGANDKAIHLLDVATKKQVKTFAGHASGVGSVSFSPDGRTLASGSWDNTVRLWDVATGVPLATLSGHTSDVTSVAFSEDGHTLASCSWDSTARLWDVGKRNELCSLMSFTDGNFAVIDRDGRFDGSDGGSGASLDWVYDDIPRNQMEPIDLDQFANLYYTPGLLAKAWKRMQLSKVPNLQAVALYPEVRDLKVAGSHIHATLIDRGGGYGDVHVLVNGIDVRTVPGRAKFDVDLGGKLAGLVKPDVRLYVYNAQNTIHSRAGSVRVSADSKEAPLAKPTIIAVVGSVQRYANPALQLSFSDADALSVTQALLAMAKGLGAEVHIELVCDDPTARTLAGPSLSVHSADKAGFSSAFKAAAKQADASSVFVVYLSGHGAAVARDGGKTNEYYYLTRDAMGGDATDLRNPAIAKQWAVSGSEIRTYMAAALNCRRRLVVLDTCEAGASQDQLLALRGEAEDQARARREFQQGTGTFALMGAAEGKASLEAAEFGHGLLTYALLQTLKLRKLGNEKSPDMVLAGELVAQTKDATRALAEAISRGQEPVAISPTETGTVVLGEMNAAARQSIVLAARLPILLRPDLVERDTLDTSLAAELADMLREMSLRRRDGEGLAPFAGFLPAESAPDAYQLRGIYTEASGQITFHGKVFQNGKADDRAFPVVVASRTDAASKLAEALRQWLSQTP